MNNITVQSRISPELKSQADEVLSSMGISMADGIRMFLQQCVNQNALPFQPTSKKAIDDLEKEFIRDLILEAKNSGTPRKFDFKKFIEEKTR